jgi:hypothetical protein
MGAMSMDLEVWVEGSAEPILVTADQRDMAAFERFHKVGTSKAMEEMTMIFFRYLGWCALRRTNQTNVGYDEWDKTIVSVEPPDEKETEVPDPTNAAA